MYSIFEKLPLEFKGHKINTSFKTVFNFFAVQQDQDLNEQEKIVTSILLFFKDLQPYEINQEYADFIVWYILGGEDFQKGDEEPCFDWLQDMNYIYCAFMQVYKIDLTKSNMHWFKFLTLFKGLPNGTKLSDIISIRLAEVPKRDKHNTKQIQSLLKMKQLYGLEKKKSIEEKINNLFGSI
jgi:hypothetical protein